jgi:hypothetical protein
MPANFVEEQLSGGSTRLIQPQNTSLGAVSDASNPRTLTTQGWGGGTSCNTFSWPAPAGSSGSAGLSHLASAPPKHTSLTPDPNHRALRKPAGANEDRLRRPQAPASASGGGAGAEKNRKVGGGNNAHNIAPTSPTSPFLPPTPEEKNKGMERAGPAAGVKTWSLADFRIGGAVQVECSWTRSVKAPGFNHLFYLVK